MFYPAKNKRKFKFILRCLSLPIVLLLLAATISYAQAMSINDLLFLNPHSEEQQTESEPLYDLTLSYRCDNNSEQYWTVTNPNSFEMTFEWFLETDENGTGAIPANGSYTLQTENIGQNVTIRFSFPQKDECRDEKCGESEIIKLTATSTTCEFNPEELPNSPQEVETTNTLENTAQNDNSHDQGNRFISKQSSNSIFVSKLSPDLIISNENLILLKDAFIHKIIAWTLLYPSYQYEQIS